MLRFVEDMSLEAIADTMGLKIGTVKTHLFRALKVIRRECDKQNNEPHGFGIKNGTRKTSSKVF